MLKLTYLTILGQSLGEKIANQLDCGDFRQTISYFGLSRLSHIEYRIKISTVTYTSFAVYINNMYIFSHKKNINFLSNSVFIVYFGTMASYTYTKLTYLSCLVFCYNFRTW